MRTLASLAAMSTFGACLVAQCPYYSNGTVSAGLSRAGGGEDARLVYVDCLDSIGLIRAKFGSATAGAGLNGMPLTLAVYDDPNDDLNPIDAVLIRQVVVPSGVTGGGTDAWQSFDLAQLTGTVVPATGGMWVAVGVFYPAGTSPGPGSIEFGNNSAPGTQWMATSVTGATINYSLLGNQQLVDIQTGPGFPPGTWAITVESGAATRPYGSGCAGTNGVPTLAGDPLFPPLLGMPTSLNVVNLPLAPTVAAALLGFAVPSPAPDLGALTGYGPTGCLLQVQPLNLTILVPSGGAAAYAFALPTTPSLAGLSVFAQALALDNGANPMGMTSTNGLRVVLGH